MYRRLTFKESIKFISNKIGLFFMFIIYVVGYSIWLGYNNVKSIFSKDFRTKWDEWKNEW
jgi:hypothetical protein